MKKPYFKVTAIGTTGPYLICETLAELEDGGYDNDKEYEVELVQMTETEYAEFDAFDGF